MLQAYKMKPFTVWPSFIYGTAFKTKLVHLEKVQNMIWRIVFGIKKYESLNATKQTYRLLNARELHVYELTNVLSKIHQDKDESTTLSTIIQPAELFADKRIKTLKSSSKQIKAKNYYQKVAKIVQCIDSMGCNSY